MLPRLSLSLGAVLLSSLLVTAAPQSTSPQAQFRDGVDVVRLDVSVLDKQRKPVEGLTSADFTVREDGKPRPIVAFTSVKVPGPLATAPAAAWTRDVAPDVVSNQMSAEGRMLVIALDESTMDIHQALARRIATAAVESLGPNDVASVIFMSRFSNVGKPQNFTNDHRLLMAPINRYSPATGPNILDCEGILWRIEDLLRLVETIGPEPTRRKIVLWIGYNLPSVSPTCETLNTLRKKLIAAAGRANVAIHVADPSGLETAMSAGRRTDNLRILPEATGGRLIVNTNAPQRLVPALIDETASYYLIGFTPSDPTKAASRKLEVTVNRRGLTVRAPSGYAVTPVADDAASTPLERAANGLRPDQGLPLVVAVAPFADVGRRTATVSVVLGVPALRGPAASTAHLRILTLDPRIHEVRPPYEAELDFSGSRTLRDGEMHEVRSSVVLKPGKYEIRAAIDAAGGRTGSVFTYVDVPNFLETPLSLSGLVLGASSLTSSVRTEAAADFLPITPTIRREFGPDETLHIFLRAYQGGDQPASTVAVTAVVLDTRGAPSRSVKMNLDAVRFRGGESDVNLTLPLAGLTPGDYLLTVGAATPTPGVTASRDLRFTVRDSAR